MPELTLENTDLGADLASHLGRFHGVGLRDNVQLTDTTIICQDGSVRAHQVLLAFGSTFLRKLFLSRHILEFEVMDFNEATAMLLGRHAGDDITLMLPDFECKTVNRILDFLYSGQCYVTSKTEVETFKGVFKSLKIDAFTVKNLQVTKSQIPSEQTPKKSPPKPFKPEPATSKSASNANPSPSSEPKPKAGTSNSKQETKKPKSAPSKAEPKGKGAKATTESAKASTPDMTCPICSQVIPAVKNKPELNRYRYTEHIVTHVKGTLFEDVPVLDAYACPHAGCDFQAEAGIKLIQHLTRTQHNELLPRVERRITEVKVNSDEHKQMTQIKATLNTLSKSESKAAEWAICTELQVLDAYDTSFHGDNYLCLICKAKFGTALKAIYHFVYTHNHKYCSSTLAPIMKKAQKEEANPIVDPMKMRDRYFCREGGCFEQGAYSTYSKCKMIGHLAEHHKLLQYCKLPTSITGTFEFREVPFTLGYKPPPKKASIENSQSNVGNGVSAVADSFSCTNCCERFSLTEAESHFRTVMHFNGNLVKCGSCEDMTGAKVKSYKEFLTYKKNHQCRQKTATPSGASNLKSNSTRQEHTVGGGGKRPIEHQTSIPLDDTGANNDSPEYNNAPKKSKPSTSQPSATNNVRGPSPPPGLLVTGRDCIEIEIDSD